MEMPYCGILNARKTAVKKHCTLLKSALTNSIRFLCKWAVPPPILSKKMPVADIIPGGLAGRLMRDQESITLRLKENIQVDGGSGLSWGEHSTQKLVMMDLEEQPTVNVWILTKMWQCCDTLRQGRLFRKGVIQHFSYSHFENTLSVTLKT